MKPAIVWVGLVVGLLVLSAGIQGAYLFMALRDPSFAVEPDYERRARDWDDVLRARRAAAALGWTVELHAETAPEPGRVDVRLELHDREGGPIGDAEVDVVAFHNARASEPLRARLPHQEGGHYRSRLPIGRSGLWEFRLEVVRGEERWVGAFRRSVISAPRSDGGSEPRVRG